MNTIDRGGVVSFAKAQVRIPGPDNERSVLVLQRGTLDVKLVLPVPPNRQTPHAQDELYVVIRGHGVLVHDGERSPFETGDVLFVAAGCEHHYENSTPELALWRIFYGVRAGEVPNRDD